MACYSCRVRFELAVALALVASCSDGAKDGDSTPAKTDGLLNVVPGDGGTGVTIVSGTGVDPSTMHLDDLGTQRPTPSQPAAGRERRPIDVTLRSSPPGARVAVDGTTVGVTPAFWNGYADGHEHEFVFTLPRHAIARYRFVPVSSGVIHARLDPIAEERDAGVAPPPEVVPTQPPSAIAPPPAPPTIVTPADAALPATGSAPAPIGSGPSLGPAPVHGPQP
jgi:hypothetical protein